MSSSILTRDTERFHLSNELHARPFHKLSAPCRAIYLALRPTGAAERDHDRDRKLLIDLLDRYGCPHPAPDAQHFAGDLGRGSLKWESHTEFVSYTIFMPGVADKPFGGGSLSLFPEEWLSQIDGMVVSATLVRVEEAESLEMAEAYFVDRLADYFAPESLSAGIVVEDEALAATDFRLHEDGLARIAVYAVKGVGPRRLGRIVQRLLEIESYKSFAMLTLPVARRIAKRVTELDKALGEIKDSNADPREMLRSLTDLAAEVERLSTESAFRFGAAGAYEAIVNDRITALRARRLRGRQLYSEFMLRRFDPAMRTCRSAERRLKELSDRVARASALLSTQVNVAVEAQNQSLLESMNRRAALQLRLQQTVEGLSVVAISYYAVSLGEYFLAPLSKITGIDKVWITAGLTPAVLLVVWAFLRRLRRHSD